MIDEHMIDKTFDAAFRKCAEKHSLTWLPWVGRDYKKTGEHRLLIVGESHYSNENDPSKRQMSLDEVAKNENFTRLVVQEELDLAWRNHFMEGLHRALVGTINLGKGRARLWQNVAFYNFIQRPMEYNEQDKERPTSEEFYLGWNTFVSILKIIRPQYVLFIGNSALNYFDAAMNAQGIDSKAKVLPYMNGAYPRSALIEVEGNTSRLFAIRHASQFFSWPVWHDFLKSQMPDEMEWISRLVFAGAEPSMDEVDDKIDSAKEPRIHTKNIPLRLEHKPIIACNYDEINGKNGALDYNDARYISLGRAQYDPDSITIKVMRHTGRKWSRQSEEVPAQRLPYMMLMLLSAIYRTQNPDMKDFHTDVLEEEVIAPQDIELLQSELAYWGKPIKHALKGMKDLLDRIDIDKLA